MDNFPLNIEIFRFFNSHHVPLLDTLLCLVRYLGTGWVLIAVLPLAIIYRKCKVRPLIIAVVVETIIVQVLKHTIVQPRPAAMLTHVHLLQHVHKGSFPSGDAAIAFAIAFTMLRGEKPWVKAAWIVYGLVIMYERMYLGAHFPLDVTAGAVIGILCAYLPYLRLKRTRGEATETETT